MFLGVLECTWMYLDVPGCTWMYPDVPGCTWMYLDVPGCTWMYLHMDVPGCTWMHMDVPGCMEYLEYLNRQCESAGPGRRCLVVSLETAINIDGQSLNLLRARDSQHFINSSYRISVKPLDF